MRSSGIFFIPAPGNSIDASNNTISALVKSILDTFDEVPYAVEDFDAPLVLQHRLLRTQPAPAQQRDGSSTPQPSFNYQHILRLSSLSSSLAYCFIQKAQQGEGGCVIGIPLNEIDSHTAFLMNQMGALWTLRLMLQVQSGRTFNVGEYNVQIGAVTIVRGNPAAAGATAPPVSPGVVVAISRATEDEDEEGQNANDNSPLTEEEKREALEYSRDCMRAFFRTILENSGLSIPTSDIPAEFSHSIFDSSKANSWPEKEDLVRLWCRTLRLRG